MYAAHAYIPSYTPAVAPRLLDVLYLGCGLVYTCEVCSLGWSLLIELDIDITHLIFLHIVSNQNLDDGKA